MNLSSKARYGVMAMVELARRGGTVTLAELAVSQEIPLPYLEQIFARLRQAGLVVSVRGPGGGYALAQTAQALHLYAIIQAVEEPLKMTRCENTTHQGCMTSKAQCLTHEVWNGLEKHIENYFSAISLESVLQGRAKALKTPA